MKKRIALIKTTIRVDKDIHYLISWHENERGSDFSKWVRMCMDAYIKHIKQERSLHGIDDEE